MQTLAQRYRDEGAKKSEEQLAQERQKFNQERVKAVKEFIKRGVSLETISVAMNIPLQELETMLPKDH